MTPKVRRFCIEYVKDQKGGPAAVRAGYSKRSADQTASRLLRIDKVRADIDARLSKIEEKSELTALDVRRAALQLMRFNPRDAFNSDGTMKRIHEMPQDLVQAVAGIDSDDGIGEIKRLRFVDRVRVIELAAKILGMLKLEITGKDGRPLVPPSPPINFTHIDDETLQRIAGMNNAPHG